jgi:peroxiredoxin
MKTGGILIPLLALALLGTIGYLWFAPGGLKTSPDISLMTIDGEQLQLASLHGRPLLVTFWATTCTVCVREIPHLIELYEELSPRGLEIIGIAMDYDPPNRVLAMRNAKNIPYPVALDIHAEAARAFGNVRLTPTSFLIAPDGRITYQKLGEMSMVKLRQDILGMLETTQANQLNPATAGQL